MKFTRRGFLAASAGAIALAHMPRIATAQSAPLRLSASTRTLDIGGRAATVFGLTGPSGQGLFLVPGQRFRVDLTNDLADPTIIHWHGQVPPNAQDGVPDMPLPLMQPGEVRSFDFDPAPGTYWMHSHVPQQEMQLLAAPLIVRSAADVAADRQEIVLFLHDFSFNTPDEVLAQITGGAGAGHAHGAAPDMGAMTQMPEGKMGGMQHGGAMSGMAMDLNDYDWDAYLANDRTLDDPEVVRVERGGQVRLRVINAAAATVFWIDTGAMQGQLIAVDGHAVVPVRGNRFGLAMGQRLDIDLDLTGEGAFPILALREGATERTGIILATPGAAVGKISGTGEAAPAFDLALESRLRAAEPLPDQSLQRTLDVKLGGTMQPYVWTLNGQTWGNHVPLTAISGERVELTFHNMSMMAHPMHLHGHVFQVVAINGQRFAGARRDTVHVPPMTMVTIALDAGEAARWMLHCHHMPHLATGMMTEFTVSP